MNQGRAKYVWDYDLTQEQFDDLLAGRWSKGSLNRDWAAVRLIEWAHYEDMIRKIGYAAVARAVALRTTARHIGLAACASPRVAG